MNDVNVVDRPDESAPRAVYIHVPFCRHRCGYCNFALVAGRQYLVDDFLKALQVELLQLPGPRSVDTIYLGGGTPSHLSPESFRRLLDIIQRQFQLDPNGEFTIEVNPEDLPGEIESLLVGSRLNRISLGVQSFNPNKLRQLDRHHSPAQIEAAVDSARRITDRISIDLMFGVASESVTMWENDLKQSLQLPINHVSTYELTVEKGTAFWNAELHGQQRRARDSTNAAMYRRARELLTVSGFEHYEISSFAQPGGRSRHNQVYWTGHSYWAFGPGASSYVDGVRRTNHRGVKTYLKQIFENGTAVAETQTLTPFERALDQVVFGLRRIQGVDVASMFVASEFEFSDIVPHTTIETLADQQLIEFAGNRLRLTERGIMFCDFVCQEIINAAPTPE